MNFIRNRNFRAGPQTSLEGVICPQNSDKQQKNKVFGRSVGGQYNKPDFEIGKVHRTPILPILVEQDAGIFTFNKSFAGETIEILIEGIVLYTSIINEGGIIEIPESITGEVELRLIRESITYHAFVNL